MLSNTLKLSLLLIQVKTNNEQRTTNKQQRTNNNNQNEKSNSSPSRRTFPATY